MYDPTHNSNERAVPSEGPRILSTYAETQRFLSLREILQVFWKRAWIIVLVALVFVGTAIGASLAQPPVYEASAKLLLGQKQDENQLLGNLMGSVEGLQQLTHTMVAAVDSRPVAEETIRQQGLQMDPQTLLDNLTVEQLEDTQFLQLTYSDSDPERAQEIVNAVSDVSTDKIAEANASSTNITVMVWEHAAVPDAPISPDPVRNGLLALGLGLMLGVGLGFVLEFLDDHWRSPEEVEQVTGVPTLGIIREFKVAKNRKKKGTSGLQRGFTGEEEGYQDDQVAKEG
jgi:capsular polysaccharide biosynthesis protein